MANTKTDGTDPTTKLTDFYMDDYLPHFEIMLRDEFGDLFVGGSEDTNESFLEVLMWAYATGFNDCMTALVDVTSGAAGIEITKDMGDLIAERNLESDF